MMILSIDKKEAVKLEMSASATKELIIISLGFLGLSLVGVVAIFQPDLCRFKKLELAFLLSCYPAVMNESIKKSAKESS